MQISIVTINYNGSENTIKLLRSLQNQTDQDFQTIVIDNASEEADFSNLQQSITKAAFAKAAFVTFVIRNKENLGFSGGNNIGIKKALENGALREASGQADPIKSPNGDNGASWVLLLNNDTWVESGFVASLKVELGALGGIVGVPLTEGDHTVPSTMLKTSYCGKIEWLKPTLKHIYNVPTSQVGTYTIGGGMVIQKSVFDKIGFLDEKYFLYFEDVDYSVRAKKAGIPLEVLERPTIHHSPSSTTKKLGRPVLMRYHYRNSLYFNWKNGPWYIKFLVWPWSWWILVKQVLKVMIYHNRDESLAIFKGVLDFYKNRMGKIE